MVVINNQVLFFQYLVLTALGEGCLSGQVWVQHHTATIMPMLLVIPLICSAFAIPRTYLS